jgi:hypothetical protein
MKWRDTLLRIALALLVIAAARSKPTHASDGSPHPDSPKPEKRIQGHATGLAPPRRDDQT